MSLLRLLTAGKSLVGLKETGHRYSEARHGLLPKFTSKKNPFRSGTQGESGPLPGEELPSAANVTEPNGLNSAHCGTGLDAPAITQPAEVQLPRAAFTQINRSPAQKTGSVSGWRAFLPWMRPRTPKPAIPRFQKAMVQGELSLESVKVMRNDLSDSDLEIVTAKPVTSSGEAKPTRLVSATPGSSEGSWERLTERFLGADKT